MRRTLLLATVLAFAPGCPDQSASNQAQSARKLDHAMDQLRRAGIGYVPADAVTPNQPVSVSDFRQKTLQDSVEELEAAAEAGSASQRMSARRMIADVHSSGARHQARQGSVEAAALANRATTLYGYLVAVDRADARAASFNTDFSTVLQTLETELSAATAEKHDAKAKLDELQPRIKSLEDKIQELRDKSGTLRTQAETMRRESFTLEGDARFDRLDEADRVQLAGDNSEFEAQRFSIDMEKLQSIEKDHQRSLAAADQKVELIAKVRAQTTQRQADATKLREEALADRTKVTTDLMTEFKQVSGAYDSVVVTIFERALAEQKQAIEQLDLAANDAAAQDRDIVNADLVGKLLDRVYVLSEYASVAGEFGRSLDSLLVRADTLMTNEHVAAMQAVRREVFNRQSQLLEDAAQTTKRAKDLITQLRQSAPDGSELATDLTTQQQALDQYAKQLQTATLDERA